MPLTPDGFLPLIDTTTQGLCRRRSASAATLAGWKTDLSLGRGHDKFDYQVHNTLNTSFGTGQPDRLRRRRPALMARTSPTSTSSREFDVGFAKPLSVAVGAEYRHENFKITPGELQSYAHRAAVPAAIATTAANCTTQQGVYNAATGICSFPGRAAPRRRAGLPRHPGEQRDRREPPQLCGLCRARHRSDRRA